MKTREVYEESKRVDDIKEFVEIILYKFTCSERSIFDPLSKLLPNYWNKIVYRAIKNILFQKTFTPWISDKSYIWTLRSLPNSTRKLAEKIYEEEKRLRKLVWSKNSWGDPYKPKHVPIVFKHDEVSKYNDKFFDNYWEKLKYYVPVEERRIELMHAILNLTDTLRDNSFARGRIYESKGFRQELELKLKQVNTILNALKKDVKST